LATRGRAFATLRHGLADRMHGARRRRERGQARRETNKLTSGHDENNGQTDRSEISAVMCGKPLARLETNTILAMGAASAEAAREA